MLLGFKRRFEPMVKDGSKTHTIRARRRDGRVPKIGEVLHCYTDVRQSSEELLGRWPCTKVEPITIMIPFYVAGVPPSMAIRIADAALTEEEIALFAWRDGFRSAPRSPIMLKPGDPRAAQEMARFWRLTHGRGITSCDFRGYVYHWDYAQPMPAPGRRRKA